MKLPFKHRKNSIDSDEQDIRFVYKCDEITDINEIVVGSIFHVTISKDISDVVVAVDKKYKDNLVSTFSVKDNITYKTATLAVTLSGSVVSTGKELARVILPESKLNIDRLELGGTADMHGGHFNAIACAVVTSGASELMATIKSKRVLINTSGSSTVFADGEAETLAIDASGSSEVYVNGLNTKTAIVTASGASKVQTKPTDNITVRASGASTVEYGRYVKHEDVKTTGASQTTRTTGPK